MSLALAALTSCDGGTSEEARGLKAGAPNLLLISIDSLRPDHLGCYGYARPTSPVIDRLAREGARFETALSTTSWTLPSHAALFTGMFDSAHGLYDNGLRLADAHHTLAEVLSERGYHTAGFFGGPYLHPTFGLDQGFDHYQSCMTTVADDLSAAEVQAESRAPVGASHRDVTGPRTVVELGRWLDALEPGRPFFAFVHLWDVHYDYIAPAGDAALFVDPAYAGPFDGRDFARTIRTRPQMTPADRAHLVALYDAEIRFTDRIVGQIVERLARDGVLDETVLVVTADHGEEFFEHGGLGHQSTLFDEQVRIPLIVRYPARVAPRAIAQPARLIDLMPTLLELAGVQEPPPMQGRSLVPLLEGGALEPAPALLELLVDRRGMRALREVNWKFLDAGRPELRGALDLANDPRERGFTPDHDIAGPGLERLRQAARATHEFGRRHVGQGAVPQAVGPGMEAQLRSLGYTGTADEDDG